MPTHTNQPNFLDQSVAVIANGIIHDYLVISRLIEDYDRIVAVDGGLAHCHRMKIQPDLIIGDFDSAAPELLKHYDHTLIRRFPTNKDATDLELAIEAINPAQSKKIGVFAALEQRTDHTLNNLFLMCRFPDKIVIESEIETLFALNGNTEIMCQPNQRISLIPLDSPVIGVTTKGLKWELIEATLNKNFLSISNICIAQKIQVNIDNGMLVCCLERTQKRSS